MKISKRIRPNGGFDYIDVFGAYYTDTDEEGFYFKLVTEKAVRQVARAGHQMRLYAHYTLKRSEDTGNRNGYINRRWELWMRGRDEAFMPIDDVKRVIAEMFTAQGYVLHWIPINRLLNMKNTFC